jgi:hypothetical protein
MVIDILLKFGLGPKIPAQHMINARLSAKKLENRLIISDQITAFAPGALA